MSEMLGTTFSAWGYSEILKWGKNILATPLTNFMIFWVRDNKDRKRNVNLQSKLQKIGFKKTQLPHGST